MNDEIALLTVAGDQVFSKPFGASTGEPNEKEEEEKKKSHRRTIVWTNHFSAFARADGRGAVRVAVLFDPYKAYGELMQLASCLKDHDYSVAFREALTKHLLPPDMLSPRIASLHEQEWMALRELPDQVHLQKQ